jgi:hypothetical protein
MGPTMRTWAKVASANRACPLQTVEKAMALKSFGKLGGAAEVPRAFAGPWDKHGYSSTCVALAVIQSTASSLVAKPSIRRS